MIGLPPKLEEIQDLQHSLYADDVTLWVAKGSDAHIEETLQEAVNVVQSYTNQIGLKCSQHKSELLAVRRKTQDKVEIKVCLHGLPIPTVDTIRVLGSTSRAIGRAMLLSTGWK